MNVDALVQEAQEARVRMQDAKKRAAAEVRARYAEKIAQEVKEAQEDAEREFAQVLARVHRRGVSQAVLRREVLRTNVWGTWTYWRDLAAITPDRAVTAARKSGAAPAEAFRWDVPAGLLAVYKSPSGEVLEEGLTYVLGTVRKSPAGLWTADTIEGDEAEISTWRQYEGFARFVSDEIGRGIESGKIEVEE